MHVPILRRTLKSVTKLSNISYLVLTLDGNRKEEVENVKSNVRTKDAPRKDVGRKREKRREFVMRVRLLRRRLLQLTNYSRKNHSV